MISNDGAIAMVLQQVNSLTPVDRPLLEAHGLVLAASVCARWDMPRWDNSAMDGFVFQKLAAEGAVAPLKIVGRAFAGHPFAKPLMPGTTLRITTGAPLPTDADTVIPLEETTEKDGMLIFQTPVTRGQHVRYRGDEFHCGEEY